MTASRLYGEYNNKSIALIGYGISGKACARFLAENGAQVSVFDTSFTQASANKPQDYANHYVHQIAFYHLDASVDLLPYDLVVVSPGVNLEQSFLKQYRKEKASTSVFQNTIVGDIEIFARALAVKNNLGTQTKLIAVTGSNGKSTVVDMLAKSFRYAGLKVALGGNFGNSALDLLTHNVDVIVLELSSFQLESTYSLAPDVACILNISSDHLDRHGDMANYIAAKQRIFNHAKNAIYNRDDANTYLSKDFDNTVNRISFGLPLSCTNNNFGLPLSCTNNNKTKRVPADSLVYFQNDQGIYNKQKLCLAATRVPNANEFQLLNMQVVLACAELFALDLDAVAESLAQYKGLAHRFELVHNTDDVVWINDSKATNPGASLVAVASLSEQTNCIVLIAGGDAKGADLSALGDAIKKNVAHLVLLGKDANAFKHFDTPYVEVSSMQEAVIAADNIVKQYLSNQIVKASPDKKHTKSKKVGVLLSPACASIDMFKNYQQRGELFSQAVKQGAAA